MSSVTLIFPHQLFEKHPALKNNTKVFLVEEYLFFNQYKLHKQKLIFHRASMKAYQHHLTENGYLLMRVGKKLSCSIFIV
jgi:deoxyribodipyrimidine photolyase-related protein